MLRIGLCEPQRDVTPDLGEEDLSKKQLTFTSMVAVGIATEFIHKDQKRKMWKAMSLNFLHRAEQTLGMEQKERRGEARRWVLG